MRSVQLYLAAVLVAAVAVAGPTAGVPDPISDAGVVRKGDDITHTFFIENTGDAILEITDVKPTCGCTVASYDRTIAPGARGKVETTLDTQSFSGPFQSTVRVFTNDAANPELQLILRANIVADIEVEPSYIRFRAVQGEATETSTHLLWPASEQNLVVRSVESPFPFLDVQVRRAEGEERRPGKPGTQWILDAKLRPNAPLGPLADYIRIETNHPRQSLVRLPISAVVRPAVAVTPPVADFGRRDFAGREQTVLQVENLTSSPVALESASVDVPGVSAEVEEIEAGERYRIVLTLAPSVGKGPFSGKLTLRTTSRVAPAVEVQLRGVAL